MSAYSKRDSQLITEAYSLQLLKESIPGMTLKQVHSNIDLLSESEAEYVCVVSERILNEFFGGVKNLLGAGKNAAQAAGQAVKGKVQQAGQAVGQAASQAGQAVGNAARGVGAAAGQVASNVKDIYDTGNVDAQATQSIEKARGLTQQLIDLVTQAQQQGLVKAQGAITDMSLADLIDTLDTAKQSASTFSQGAQKQGFTGGIGAAYNKGSQPAPTA